MATKLNLTEFVEANTIIDMIEGIDQAAASQMGGLRPLPILLIISVFFIIVVRGIRTVPAPDIFTAAFSIATVLSLFFATPLVGWLPGAFVVAPAIGLAISAIAMFKSKSS